MTSRRSNDDTRAPWAILAADLVAMAPTLAALPPPTAVEIAFAGRSNVGKSSLMNALLGRRRLVRTSGTPGCTRALGLFSATARDGRQFVLVDLPGYGYAQRARSERAGWASLIESYLAERAALGAVVVLIDARHGLTEADQSLVELLAAIRAGGHEPTVAPGPLPFVIAATKLDKVAPSRRKAELGRIERSARVPVVGVSAVTGEGVGPLWQLLRRMTLNAPSAADEQSSP